MIPSIAADEMWKPLPDGLILVIRKADARSDGKSIPFRILDAKTGDVVEQATEGDLKAALDRADIKVALDKAATAKT